MGDNKKMLKSTALYFLGNILSKAIVFILLPLYTKYIDPSDYGVYEVTLTYINILMSLLYFDIWSTVLRFMHEFAGKEKFKAIYSGSFIFLISSALYIITFSLLGHFVKIPYSSLAICYGIIVNLTNVYGRIARGFDRSKLFAVSGIIATAVNAICNVVCIVYLKMDYSVLYISYILGSLTQILIIEGHVKVIANFKREYLNYKLFKEMLFFSLPLCMNSVGYWILTGFNKLYIAEAIGAKETGLYAIASKFSMILSTLADCFLLAWQDLAFAKKGTKEEKEIFFSNMLNGYAKFLFGAAIFILSGISIIFPFYIDAKYAEAKQIIPICIIATLFSILNSFLGSIFGSLKKNKLLFVSTVTGALVNIFGAILLVKEYGIFGVNISMALGFIVSVIIRYITLNRYITLKLNLSTVVICIFASVFGVMLFKQNILVNIVADTLLCLVIYKKYNKEIRKIAKKIGGKVGICKVEEN